MAFIVRFWSGDQHAGDQLILSNMGLIRHVVNKYRSRDSDLQDDLLSVGMEGLIYAVNKVDPDKFTKISTYATWWISQRVRLEWRKNRTIYFPTYFVDTINAVASKLDQYNEQHGTELDLFDETSEPSIFSLKMRQWGMILIQPESTNLGRRILTLLSIVSVRMRSKSF
jgi:RNA polymerase sigma factor (sigma-70 family)